MKHKYKIDLVWDPEDAIYVASAPELDGCMSHGATEHDALRNVERAITGWIATAKKCKMPIPKPITQRRFSGCFNIRIPQDIHRRLTLMATEAKVSLNHLVSQILVKAT